MPFMLIAARNQPSYPDRRRKGVRGVTRVTSVVAFADKDSWLSNKNVTRNEKKSQKTW